MEASFSWAGSCYSMFRYAPLCNLEVHASNPYKQREVAIQLLVSQQVVCSTDKHHV
jgi:hypothetical protein